MRLCLSALCLILPLCLWGNQRQVTITFDDLPWLEGQATVDEVALLSDKILRTLHSYGVSAVGFVNEDKISRRKEYEIRRNILRRWLEDGHELGNHSAAHQKLSQETLEEFYRDVVRGEKTVNGLLREMGQPPMRFFRYPYLDLGTSHQRGPAKQFLRKRGYTVVGITLDSRDWEFNAKFRQARQIADEFRMDQIRREFLKFLDSQLPRAGDGEGREILLFHACTLTAESLEDILGIIRGKGYTFYPLDNAHEKISTETFHPQRKRSRVLPAFRN